MTTTPASSRTAPRVLAVSIAAVLVGALLTAGLAALVAGTSAAAGALVGGGIAVSFFAVGSSVVSAATRVAPQAALLVALLTYTLQVAVVALVFALLVSSGALEQALSREWLAVGVAAATGVWIATQMIATARARVPAYDLPTENAQTVAHTHSPDLHGPVSGSSKAGAS